MTKIALSIATTTMLLFTAISAHADPDDPTPPPAPMIDSAGSAPLSMQDVLSANPAIANPNLIYPGQIIAIPGRDPHTVVPGDTLNAILGPVSSPAPLSPPETPPQAPAPVSAPSTPKMSINWDAVAHCESGGNWAINTGNSYEGGLQFLNSTWNSVKPAGAPPHAYQATRNQQIAAAETLLHRSGIGQWPVCGRRG